jgi:hypothetical protein
MARRAEHGVRIAMLDDAAEIHHRDLVRDVLDHRQVVADEHQRQVKRRAQFREQVQDLRLHGYVERRCRLVADQDARLHHQRARDGDALALPAGKLRRIARRHLRPEADLREHRRHAPVALGAAAAAGRDQGQRHDVGDAAARVQRTHRVLEHRLDQPRPLAPVHRGQRAAVDAHRARRRRQQAQQQARQRRFAAARLAHDGQRASRLQRQRDVVHRHDAARGRGRAAALLEAARQPDGFDRNGHAASRHSGSRRQR